jgi:hypothetical protein
VKSDGLADHTSTSNWTSPAAAQPTASTSAGPTLQECWESINAYLTKFNGSQNNFTFLISYDEVALTFSGLLDDYPGAEAAYSLRLLDKDYTGDAVRVRRASNNDEQDIGFDSNGDLDTSALATFCSGTDCFVKVWYDQSSNGNDATQTTTSEQPKIYDSSTGVIIDASGNSTLFFDIPHRLLCSTGSVNNNNMTLFFAGERTNDSGRSKITQFTGYILYFLEFQTFALYVNTNTLVSTGTKVLGQVLITTIVASGDVDLYLNGSLNNSGSTTGSSSGSLSIGGNIGGALTSSRTISEIIIYQSDQSSNRTDIETNINDYYSIY